MRLSQKKFEGNSLEKWHHSNQGNSYMPQKHFERKEVRVATLTCFVVDERDTSRENARSSLIVLGMSTLRGDRLRKARTNVVTSWEKNKGLSTQATRGKRAPKR